MIRSLRKHPDLVMRHLVDPPVGTTGTPRPVASDPLRTTQLAWLAAHLRSAYPAHARSFDRAKMFLSAQQALERAETHLEEGHAIEARREVTTVLRYGDRRLRFLGAALMATPNPLAKRLLLRRRMS